MTQTKQRLKDPEYPTRYSTIKSKEKKKGVNEYQVIVSMGGGKYDYLTTHNEQLWFSEENAKELSRKVGEVLDSYSHLQLPVPPIGENWIYGVENWGLVVIVSTIPNTLKGAEYLRFYCRKQQDMYEVYEKIYSLFAEINSRN